MGWWDFGQIGFRCDDIYRNQVKDLLECFGVDFETKYGTNVDRFYSIELDDYGVISDDRYDIETIYAVVSRFCQGTTIYYEYEDGNTICDAYNRYEQLYDPAEKKVLIGEAEYCYDGYEVFGRSVFYSMLKEKCERAAKNKHVPVRWKNTGYEKIPGSNKFKDVCIDVLYENGGLEHFGRKAYTKPIPDEEIEQETIIRLIDDAAKIGHNTLAILIGKTFGVDYKSPFMRDLPDENSRYNERIYYRYRDTLLKIKRYNEIYKTDDWYKHWWNKDCDIKVLERIKKGTELRIKSYPVNRTLEFAEVYYGDELIGVKDTKWFPKEALGLDENAFLWLVVKKSKKEFVNTSFNYRLLDLDFELLKDEIIKRVGRELTVHEGDIPHLIESVTIHGDYISELRIENEYDRKYLLEVANILGIDILRFDRGVSVPYDVSLRWAIDLIGDRFELEKTNVGNRNDLIETLQVGEKLELYVCADDESTEIDVRKKGESIGLLPKKVARLLAAPLNSGKIVGIAEVTKVIPLSQRQQIHKNHKKGLVYVKLFIKENIHEEYDNE